MLTVDEARALVTTSLSDADLEDVIEREEAWLARRIGPLEGERIETFVSRDGDEVLRLQRPADSVAVEDDSGSLSAFSYRRWSDVVPGTSTASLSWAGDVLVTYTPNDELEVKRSLITLVRLAVSESAYASQAAGGYSQVVSLQDQRTMRFLAWRTLLRPRIPDTVRLTSAIPLGGASIVGVAVSIPAS